MTFFLFENSWLAIPRFPPFVFFPSSTSAHQKEMALMGRLFTFPPNSSQGAYF